jgi:hypothetical protein
MFWALIRVRVPPYFGTSLPGAAVFDGAVDDGAGAVVLGSWLVVVAAGPAQDAKISMTIANVAVSKSFLLKYSSSHCSTNFLSSSPDQRAIPWSSG